MIRPKFHSICALAVLPPAGVVQATVLYDGSLGTLPQTQGWLAYESLNGTAIVGTTASGIKFDTTTGTNAQAEYAGFANYNIGIAPTLVNPAFPNLDPTAGFKLSFDAKIDAESHASNDRAGFDVILLGNNLKGIELGFWNNEIFAQSDSPIFTHAESTTNFDPTVLHHYDLQILGGNYALYADGMEILGNATRDYSSYPLPQGLPYRIPDFVFLGDDTSSAEGTTEINSMSISVPEPTIALAVFPLVLLARRRAKR